MNKLLCLVLTYILSASAAYCSQVDISSSTGGWTHTDPSSTITETKHRVRWESHDCSDNAWNYKAQTVSGNFTHWVTFGFDATSDGQSAMGIWAVTDTAGGISQVAEDTDAHAIILYLEDTGTACTLKLIERDGATIVETQTVTLAEKYRYRSLFLKADRTSSTFTATIYRGPGQTEQLYQLSQTLNSVQTYDYIMLAQSSGSTVRQIDAYATGQDSGGTITSTLNIAQTFTPPKSHYLSWVDVYAAKKGTGCSDVKVYIYATSSGHPTGSAIATSTGQSCTGWSTSYEWHRFTFATPLSITASTKYAIAMKSNGNSTNSLVWGDDSTSPTYSGGNFEYFSGSWKSYTTDDFLFKQGSLHAGTANGFTSALYINETPKIFTRQTTAPLIYPEDYDGFSGYPSSHETWTESESGTSTIAESSSWDSDGDGKSVVITQNAAAAYAYAATSNTTFGGGIMRFTFKITSLGTNEGAGFAGMWSSSASKAAIAFIKDVSGTKYFRIKEVGGSSTATNMICALNTEYDVVIVQNNYTGVCAIIVDGILADACLISDDFTPDRIFIGAISTEVYGTMYIDEMIYMNGTGYGPSISRGGDNDSVLMAAFRQDDSHGATADAIGHIAYSTDNGSTWEYFYNTADFAAGSIRWCDARSSWFVFGGIIGTSNCLYEITDLETPTLTEIRDYIADDSRDFAIWPSRELDSTGKLYVAMENYDDETYDWLLTSARLNWADGVLSTEQPFCDSGDVYGSYTVVAEPQLWLNSSGQLCSTIRFCDDLGRNNDVRYKVSTDLGATDWTSNSLVNPGTDHYQRNAIFRWFPFEGDLWCQGRDNQYDDGGTLLTDWDTCIMRVEKDTLAVVDEVWFPSLGEGGNGDIDAKVVVGSLYIDIVTDMYSSAWFMRMDTGEIGVYNAQVIGF